jgi:hypothetical protein
MAHELTIGVGATIIGMAAMGVCPVLLRDAFGDRRTPRRPPA